MGRPINLVGQRFGRLIVVRKVRKRDRRIFWSCKCDCGGKKITRSYSLKRGDTQSCGCFHKERVRQVNGTHGMRETKIYRIWCHIRRRCFDKKHPHYIDYGGRGITVCSAWLKFENFYKDMGNCPPNKSIDRINNNGGYSCGHCTECKQKGWTANCKFSTAKEQANNTRRTVFITHRHKKIELTKLVGFLQLRYCAFLARLKRKQSVGDAIKKAKDTILRQPSGILLDLAPINIHRCFL